MIEFGVKYKNWYWKKLFKLYAAWGLGGSMLFCLCWLISILTAILLLWAGFSLFVDESTALTIAILFTAPHIVTTVLAYFASLVLSAEVLWTYTGIYKLFGVAGMPLREVIFKDKEVK